MAEFYTSKPDEMYDLEIVFMVCHAEGQLAILNDRFGDVVTMAKASRSKAMIERAKELGQECMDLIYCIEFMVDQIDVEDTQ